MYKRLIFSFFFILLLVNQALAQSNYLQSGPMVGYSTMKEVALWVQTTQEARVKFVYWDKEVPQKKFETDEAKTTEEGAYTAQLKADQVLPDKRYEYELYINGKLVKRPYPLEFQTQALWQWRTDPPDFKFALGSCTFINEPQFDRPGKPYGGEYEIFTAIHQQKPDFMLWLGDNMYLREIDWNSRTGIMHRFTHTRSVAEMQPLLGSTHNYAIWDDHDYGPDNSDRSFWKKETTLEAFKLFWANPNYVIGNNGGITGTFNWMDAQFFLLDNRWCRTPNERKIGERTLLGEKQLQWLIDALIYSRATFKFVVIGGQVLNPVAGMETYTTYEKEKEYLLKAIQEAKVQGVIFLDGDRHHTELTKLEREGTYPLYDLTVSPLTAGSHDANTEANTLRVPNTFVGQRNFGIIEVAGPRKERVLTIQIMDNKGKELWSRQLKASELR